jgi:hypothetical protein
MLEFSEEGVLCWKAIQKFRAAPGEAAARELYKQFIAEGAPQQVWSCGGCWLGWVGLGWVKLCCCVVDSFCCGLQVNLSHNNVSRFTALLNSSQPDAVIWNTSFNDIEKELVHMLEADTYGRFKTSPLFVR